MQYPIKMNNCYQDCDNNSNTTTVQYVNQLFDGNNPNNYILFPSNPDLGDLHIAPFQNGTAYYVYNGEWVFDNFKEDYTPACITPCDHIHDITDISGLSNLLDTLFIALDAFANNLNAMQDQLDVFSVPAYTHPNHTGDVTSNGDGATTIVNDAVTTLKIALGAVTGSRIANSTITSDKLFNESVINSKIATDAVTTSKILDGNVTTSKIADDAVTNDKLSNVATGTLKGRSTVGTGSPEDLTASQARTLLNVADGANNYSHPNHTGDVTSSGDGATTIAANAVTTSKIQDDAVTDDKLSHTTVTPGSYSNPTLTVNQQGRVTSIAPGVGTTIEEALNTSAINLGGPPVTLLSLTLPAGTWLLQGLMTIINGQGIYELELYNDTDSISLQKSFQSIGAFQNTSVPVLKKVVISSTTTFSLKGDGGSTTIPIGNAILTAIK